MKQCTWERKVPKIFENSLHLQSEIALCLYNTFPMGSLAVIFNDKVFLLTSVMVVFDPVTSYYAIHPYQGAKFSLSPNAVIADFETKRAQQINWVLGLPKSDIMQTCQSIVIENRLMLLGLTA